MFATASKQRCRTGKEVRSFDDFIARFFCRTCSSQCTSCRKVERLRNLSFVRFPISAPVHRFVIERPWAGPIYISAW